MSYSTMLYAVDLDALKSAVGSRDAGLVERVRRAIQDQSGGERPVDPTTGPRVRVTASSEIELNGTRVSPDDFLVALLNPDWAGTYLYLYQASPQRGEQRAGQFKEPGSFIRFLGPAAAAVFEARGLIFKKHITWINICSTEEDFLNLRDPNEDLSDDQALEELIAGKFTRRDCAHVYGYALENLCQTIGTFLDAVGTDRLQSLNLKTPLSKTRLPVKLPKIEEFPYISYLDAADVQREVERLRSLDLTCPDDPDLEDERKYFLQLLEAATQQQKGVVGFYH